MNIWDRFELDRTEEGVKYEEDDELQEGEEWEDEEESVEQKKIRIQIASLVEQIHDLEDLYYSLGS